MAALATQQIVLSGLAAPTFNATAVGGDTVAPSDTTFIVVKNAHTSAQSVSLAVPGNLATGDAYPDKVVSVPNAEERWIGPLSSAIFRDPATGRVLMTYPLGVTALTVAVVKI